MNERFSNRNMRVTVVGGGNIGTQFACTCASKGYAVTMFTQKPQQFNLDLEIVDEHDEVVHGTLARVTNNLEIALEDCGILFVTYPAFMLQGFADEIFPYIKDNVIICMIPGTGGAEFAFKKCIDKGAVLCGLQRVPSVARLEEYGKRVRCEGLRDELNLGAIPSAEAADISELMEYLWGIPCRALPNYLSVTLTPSNPILHTTRLRTLFSDYHPGVIYDRNPLFYGEWSDDSSELMIACDQELQEICGRLSDMDLSNVKSLKIHYESDTVEAMTRKLSSIASLHNLSSPMIKENDGWIPDFHSRYFTADFPYGLAILEGLANIVGVSAPNIHNTMEWYRDVTDDHNKLDLHLYGIDSVLDLYQMYR